MTMKWSYLWTWLSDLLVFLFVVLPLWGFWGENLAWDEGILTFNIKKDSWPDRTWYRGWGATCYGHAVMYSSAGVHPITRVHERHHSIQYQAGMLGSLITGLIVAGVLICVGAPIAAAVTGILMWVAGYFLVLVPSWLEAAIRGVPVYMGCQHEVGAYAVAYKFEKEGQQ